MIFNRDIIRQHHGDNCGCGGNFDKDEDGNMWRT